jgi:hypothetical protein
MSETKFNNDLYDTNNYFSNSSPNKLNTILTTKPFDKNIPNLINPSILQQIENNLNEPFIQPNKLNTISHIYQDYIAPNGIIIFFICLIFLFIFIRYYFFADVFNNSINKNKDIKNKNKKKKKTENDKDNEIRNSFVKNKIYNEYYQHYKNDIFQDDESIELVGTDDDTSYDYSNDSPNKNMDNSTMDNSTMNNYILDHGTNLLENEEQFRYNIGSFNANEGFKNRDKIAKEMFR